MHHLRMTWREFVLLRHDPSPKCIRPEVLYSDHEEPLEVLGGLDR